MKSVLLFCLFLVCASCTTLENRRDLYRSPAEGYERWYRHAPPTRIPSVGPVRAVPGATLPGGNNGVITFPEESPPLPARGG